MEGLEKICFALGYKVYGTLEIKRYFFTTKLLIIITIWKITKISL